jgi:2',3'-cyclic-nucleotide 2'-phosphodiesterase/3'-nucleotidase
MNIKYSLWIMLAAAAGLLCSCSDAPADGDYSFTLLTTNDVHGTYFDSAYVDNYVKKSLYSVKYIVDSVRKADGADNVLLVDAGDILQGDNSAYYYNYIDTVEAHVYSRMAAYMGYDAVTVGNHDVETGHRVYDRVARELGEHGIPFLAGNAIRTDNGKPYFPLYKVVMRNGVKIAILGYTNANMKEWLSEDIWSGMTFERIASLVQKDVDKVRSREKPQIVIVSCHTATGSGDGKILESEGLDIFKTVKGVDFLICSHDHRPFIACNDSIGLINSGSHCRYVGEGKIDITIKSGKVASKKLETRLIPVDKFKIDTAMARMFHDDYVKVKEFTLADVGTSDCDLVTRDSFIGMCPYMDLLHTISLSCSPARISIAAPLTYNKTVPAGNLVYNDLSTIYPYENQLIIANMTGAQIKKYLEASYGHWINTLSSPSDHLLKIKNSDDARTGQEDWSFVDRYYNFDSMGGLFYEVDVTKPEGERVSITSLSDGSPFSTDSTYSVAMTSYRANGGGGLLKEAGIDPDSLEVVARYPEIRNILYEYIKAKGGIKSAQISRPNKIGGWKFVPEEMADQALERDFKLLFPE